jgi:hypothetical protein
MRHPTTPSPSVSRLGSASHISLVQGTTGFAGMALVPLLAYVDVRWGPRRRYCPRACQNRSSVAAFRARRAS